jgi:hypothetical protein
LIYRSAWRTISTKTAGLMPAISASATRWFWRFDLGFGDLGFGDLGLAARFAIGINHRWRLILRWNINPRYLSLHIVIRQNAPVTLIPIRTLSIGTISARIIAGGTVVAIAITQPAAARARAFSTGTAIAHGTARM